MCGLGGYNCSLEFAEKYLNKDKQEKILVEAWLHNLHRGWEAAGYMGFAGNAFKSWKRPGSAADLLINTTKKNKVPDLEVMQVFGAHTRQHTIGNPKVNTNNHPVNVGKVWVTHNGNVTNNLAIKATLNDENIPEVDSSIIAAVLNERVTNPRNIAEVIDALAPLTGNIAFHAVWENEPGLSVLCKGTGSPLILAYHAAGIIVYASTVECVYSMIAAMGLKPDDKFWNYRNLDSNKVIIFDNGEPIQYDALPYRNVIVNQNSTWAKAKHFVRRLNPKGEVYSTDILADWPLKFGEMGRDITFLPENQELKEKYTREQGFVEKTDQFTFTNIFAPFGEADRIVYDPRTYVWHVFYDDIEIIAGSDRKIFDVYNHALMKPDERWLVEDKEVSVTSDIVSVPPVMTQKWDEFYIAKTTAIANLPSEQPEYEYVLQMEAIAKRKEEEEARKKKQLPFRGSDNVVDLSKRGSGRQTAYSEEPFDANDWDNDYETAGYLHALTLVDWGSFPKLVWNGKGAEGVAFIDNGTCSIHKQTLREHDKPLECKFAQFAALYALSCSEDLDIARCMMSELGCETLKGKTNTCNPDDHKWYPHAQRRVQNGKVHFDLVTAEDCWTCGSIRRLTNFPDWARHFMTQERSIVNNVIA